MLVKVLWVEGESEYVDSEGRYFEIKARDDLKELFLERKRGIGLDLGSLIALVFEIEQG